MHLGVIDTKGADADESRACGGRGFRNLLDDEILDGAEGGDDDGFHCVGHCEVRDQFVYGRSDEL